MRQLFGRTSTAQPDPIDDHDLISLYRHHPGADDNAWLRTNFVTTLDGSVQGADHRSGSINTPSDNRVFALQRALADVIIVGAETVRTEGYQAVDLEPWQREIRRTEGLQPLPLLVIISSSLDIDPEVAGGIDGDTCPVMIITSTDQDEQGLPALRNRGVEIVQIGAETVDLTEAVQALWHRGHRRLLCEGGPHLHHGLLAADLVDEMCQTVAPLVVGGDGLRTTAGPLFTQASTFELNFSLYADDGTLFTSYTRCR